MRRIGWCCYLGGYLDTWRVLLFLFALPACVVWIGFALAFGFLFGRFVAASVLLWLLCGLICLRL